MTHSPSRQALLGRADPIAPTSMNAANPHDRREPNAVTALQKSHEESAIRAEFVWLARAMGEKPEADEVS